MLMKNPRGVTQITSSFIPDTHGRDADTLVAWMNSRGMRFAAPRTGDESAYSRLFTIKHELHALLGTPILEKELVATPRPQ